MSLAEPLPPTAPTDAVGIAPLRSLPRRSAQTTLNATVLTRRIASVIESWEMTLTGVMSGSVVHGTALRQVGETTPTLVLIHDASQIPQTSDASVAADYPADAVAAVAFLARTLQVSQDEVLTAAGIAERTFFGWKTTGRRPRPASTGTLWALVEVFYYLRDSRPNVAAWLHSTPDAKTAFATGDAGRLVDLDLSTRSPRPADPRDLPDYGDDGSWHPVEAAPRRRAFSVNGAQTTTFPRR